jgi:hypothetical protein
LTTVAFDLLAGPGIAFKPSGLIDGVTNFYAPGITETAISAVFLFVLVDAVRLVANGT